MKEKDESPKNKFKHLLVIHTLQSKRGQGWETRQVSSEEFCPLQKNIKLSENFQKFLPHHSLLVEIDVLDTSKSRVCTHHKNEFLKLLLRKIPRRILMGTTHTDRRNLWERLISKWQSGIKETCRSVDASAVLIFSNSPKSDQSTSSRKSSTESSQSLLASSKSCRFKRDEGVAIMFF